MVTGANVMHSEAVNVDIYLCILLGNLPSCMVVDTVRRVLIYMKILRLIMRGGLNVSLEEEACIDQEFLEKE